MRLRAIAAGAAVTALSLFAIGCDPAARHRVLTTFFDGVPPLEQEPAPGAPAAPAVAAPREAGLRAHGPYAARMCNACHTAAARNELVAPREKLCFHCHEFPTDKKYVHGPLASGGCIACHDPHSSRYRYMLLSRSDGFCLHCHRREDIARNPVHAGVGETCTTCHDAHMSNEKYLLK